MNRRIYLREAFRIDLIEFLKEIMNADYSIILYVDINKNVHDRKLQKRLQSIDLVRLSIYFL